MLSLPLLASLLAAAPVALAQLSTFRATVPGSLHQCDNSSLVFFDSGGTRPLDVLFLPSGNLPASLSTGDITLAQALTYKPLLALGGIETVDNDPYPFFVQIPAGDVVELFGFLPGGSGKALSLTRTIMTPLPSASACLVNIPTSIDAGAVTATGSSSGAAATSTGTAAASSSVSGSKASSGASVSTPTGASSSSAASSTSTTKSSGASALSFSGAAVAIGLVVAML